MHWRWILLDGRPEQWVDPKYGVLGRIMAWASMAAVTACVAMTVGLILWGVVYWGYVLLDLLF